MKIKAKQYASAWFEMVVDNPGQEKDLTIRLASLLSANNQLSLVPEIIEHFGNFWNKRHSTVEAKIISARKLAPALIEDLKKFISSRSNGQSIEAEEIVDKSILGGVVMRYGGKMFDLSLKSRLEDLRQELIK